jgi:hypothetical protein
LTLMVHGPIRAHDGSAHRAGTDIDDQDADGVPAFLATMIVR